MSHALSAHEPYGPRHRRVPLRLSPSGAFRASVGALALLAAAIVPAQTLFSATEHAEAGQAVSVTGSGFDGTSRLTLQRYGSTGVLGASVSVPVTSQSDLGLVGQLPAGLAFGIFRLQASSAAGTGGSILLNAPRVQWTDAKQAMPGQSVRLVGRNLRPAAPASTVRVVDTTTGASLPAAVTAASDYDLTFTWPATIAGHTYRAYVNSNIAGAASEAAVPTTVGAVAQAADPFGLGTVWGPDFGPIAAQVYNLKTDPRLATRAPGNGVADDGVALQAAIDLVSQNGGGTVYIPAGTYRIDNGNTILLRSKVVLKGAGAGQTILQVGYRFNQRVAPNDNWAMMFANCDHAGLTELTLRNLNANATPNPILRGATPDLSMPRCFMKNVAVDVNNGLPISLGKVREMVIQGCQFTSTALGGGGPINFNGAQDLRFTNNVVDYRTGRMSVCLGLRDLVEANAIRINGAFFVPGANETGGIETSFSQDVLVSRNSVAFYGTNASAGGDGGEMIMAQCTIPDLWDAGRVASASGLTLVPTSRTWPDSWLCWYQDNLDRSYVAIVRGKGAGQWRRITSHDASSLTIDKPWAVVPDSTSTYSIGSFVALEQTWIGNSIQNGMCGMMLWNGGIDCAMGNNTLKDTGGIVVRATTQPSPGPGSVAQCIAWNDAVRDNAISTTNASKAANVSISGIVTTPVADQPAVGSLVLGVSALGNRVTGSMANTGQPLCCYDGFELLNANERGNTPDPLANWGTVLWNDSVTNSQQGFKTNLADSGVDSNLQSIASSNL